MPPNESPVEIELKEKFAFWLCIAAWVLSFFLPTTVGDGFLHQSALGIGAFIGSVIGFWLPVYGWVWPVNIFMALAPVFARRIEKGKGGGAYVPFLCTWAMLPLALPVCQFVDYKPGVEGLKVGYYVWQMSLLGTATWFLWVTTRRRSVLISAGVVTFLFGIGSGVLAPEFIVRRHLRNAIYDVDKAIAKVEQGAQPISPAGPSVAMHHFVDFRHAGVRDLDLATAFMSDIYACHGRDRISDLKVIDRYPEIPVHPADPLHQAQAPGDATNGTLCTKDDSASEPWINYRDLQPAALERAKLYLRNSKVDLWMERGRRQMPQPLGSAELPLPDQPVWNEVPVSFTNMDGLVVMQKAGSSQEIKIDRNAILHKGDRIMVGTHSSATLGFVDGTTCTMGPASAMSIRDNSNGWAGRKSMKVLLDSGGLVMDTPMRLWRSRSGIESFGIYTIELGAESSVDVERTVNGLEVLLRRGSGEIRSGNNRPVTLVENERIILR